MCFVFLRVFECKIYLYYAILYVCVCVCEHACDIPITMEYETERLDLLYAQL